jgi:hypothetical protein
MRASTAVDTETLRWSSVEPAYNLTKGAVAELVATARNGAPVTAHSA